MRILVTGASGLIGSAICDHFSKKGETVLRLSRKSVDSINWDPQMDIVNIPSEAKIDVLIHLAGEPIVGWWTLQKKQKIRDSRVNGTKLLCRAIKNLKTPPKLFLCASAIGYYGDRGEESLSEDSLKGEGFLPQVCVEWEAAASEVASIDTRVASLRIGLVLSKQGGALKAMLPAFRFCLGGRLGDGHQYYSWITIDDLVSAVDYIIKTEALSGPINMVSPEPVRNIEFTKALGAVLSRPTPCPVPAFIIRSLLGEMGQNLLLSSARVYPKRLLQNGFEFKHKSIYNGLNAVL